MSTLFAPIVESNFSHSPFCEHTFKSESVSSHFAFTSVTTSCLKKLFSVSGSTTSDGSSNVSINSTLANIDASKITSGTLNADRLPEIPISKIPAAAMERLYVVESQSAAMSLTIQEGDVVQIGSGGPMYFCVSESASTFATKFKEFTAGSATSVPWSGVTGKPTFATVATSGSYNDLTNKPTIPSLSGYATQN